MEGEGNVVHVPIPAGDHNLEVAALEQEKPNEPTGADLDAHVAKQADEAVAKEKTKVLFIADSVPPVILPPHSGEVLAVMPTEQPFDVKAALAEHEAKFEALRDEVTSRIKSVEADFGKGLELLKLAATHVEGAADSGTRDLLDSLIRKLEDHGIRL